MNKYWTVGDNCVLRGTVNNQVWMAKSVIVVKDDPEETVLLLIPGAQCAFPEGYWRRKKNRDYSQGTRWQEAKREHILLREFTWQTNRILMFLNQRSIILARCFGIMAQISLVVITSTINYPISEVIVVLTP